MKKIMFNDKYGLTKAVLEGRKTMTRRIIKAPRTMEGKDVYGFSVVTYRTGEVVEVMAIDEDEAMIGNILPKYKVGEVVAVSQAYKDVPIYPFDPYVEDTPGWNNKMFVRADLMPHQIRITNVWVERLQDISEEDCRKEGIDYVGGYSESYYFGHGVENIRLGNSYREAFAALIDKVSGKGTFESNPWVYVYEFNS